MRDTEEYVYSDYVMSQCLELMIRPETLRRRRRRRRRRFRDFRRCRFFSRAAHEER